MHNKRPVKEAKEGWGSQKLNGPQRLLRSGRYGQGGAHSRGCDFGWLGS